MVVLRDGHGDIVALKCTSFVVLRVNPSAEREFVDEDLRRLGEENRGFCTYHLHLHIDIKVFHTHHVT